MSRCSVTGSQKRLRKLRICGTWRKINIFVRGCRTRGIEGCQPFDIRRVDEQIASSTSWSWRFDFRHGLPRQVQGEFSNFQTLQPLSYFRDFSSYRLNFRVYFNLTQRSPFWLFSDIFAACSVLANISITV